jgi:tetratricopeptide (TPR) repeat protein
MIITDLLFMSKFNISSNALRKLAIDSMNQGHTKLAIFHYKNLVEQYPERADDWYNLAYLQRCARYYQDSLDSYEMSLAHDVDNPEEIHLNMAVIFSEFMNNAESAIRHLKLALVIRPNFIEALINLGNIFEDVGNFDEAKSYYKQILKNDAANGRALGRLAIMETISGHSQSSVNDLKNALSKSSSPINRVEIAFALGHVLDAKGLYEDAFHAFQLANTTMINSMSPNQKYNFYDHECFIDSLIKVFNKSNVKSQSNSSISPIFICGMFRSGSTLLEQILSRHSRVTAGGEFEIIPALIVEELMPYPDSLITNNILLNRKLQGAYYSELKRLYPSFDIITDKRPDNFLHIGLIKQIFPDAKFIHTNRNQLDNILSIYFGNFSEQISYSHCLNDIKHWYDQYIRIMDHWKNLYPDDIFDLNYDALVKEPDIIIAQLLSFCQLKDEIACYKYSDRSGAVRTLSAWQVRQSLHKRSSSRWKNYTTCLSRIGLI